MSTEELDDRLSDFFASKCCNVKLFSGELPLTGKKGILYVSEDGEAFVWNGSTYISIGGGVTDVKCVVQADMLSGVNTSYSLPHIVDTFTEIIDTTNSFDPVTGIFTAPKAGNYYVGVWLYGSSSAGNLELYKNGVSHIILFKEAVYVSSVINRFHTLRKVLSLAQGDTLYLLMDSADYVYGAESSSGLSTYPGYINIIEL